MTEQTEQPAATLAEGETVTKPEGEKPEGETTKEAAEPKEGEEGTEGEEGNDDEGRPRKLSGSRRQKLKIDHLQTELADANRRLDDLQRRLPKEAGGEADDDPKPKEDDFKGDYFAYQTELTAWTARQAVKSEFAKAEARKGAESQRDVQRERAIAHTERVEEARETIADFDETLAKMKGVSVRNEVIDEIMGSDKSALLSYHLAKNPETLRRLNELSGRELAREIGRLEGSVRMPAAKKQTGMPPPLAPLKGGTQSAFNPETASMAEYVAERQRQEKAAS